MDKDSIDNFIRHLKSAPLGGIEAQFRLAPEYRVQYDLADIKSQKSKQAAVAIILFNDNGTLKLVLTKRADYSGHHSGQISFPGGKQSDSDKTLFDTARRETFEEIAVTIEQDILIRSMTELYIPVSGFLVFPFLVYLPYKPLFVSNYEVDRVLTPAWDQISQADAMTTQAIITKHGKTFNVKGITWREHFIWGATAMMLSELLEMIQKFNS